MNEQLTLVKTTLVEILALVDRERENEIITRRFGIDGERATLEAVGDEMGITRERVRQIEKVALERLREKLATGGHDNYNKFEKVVIRTLSEMGRAAKIGDLTRKLTKEDSKKTAAAIQLLTTISGKLVTLTENNTYHQSVALKSHDEYDEKSLKTEVDNIVKILKEFKTPLDLESLFEKTDYEHPTNVAAIASLSKQIASLNGRFGMSKSPLVNPRNIRDKIYVILENNTKPMHYTDIHYAIENKGLNRRKVTKQAIHNELIKDPRFVLIGRGIYALAEWGYKSGNISEVITEVLREAGKPLRRSEIVTQVLKQRQVREATILLNLQNKPQFIRVAKGQYTVDETK